jgi:hypothetical protein
MYTHVHIMASKAYFVGPGERTKKKKNTLFAQSIFSSLRKDFFECENGGGAQ